MECHLKTLAIKKNSAYGRRVQIEPPIQKSFKLNFKEKKRKNQVSGVKCQVSGVTCLMLYITCHMSHVMSAIATDPPPAYSPTMHSKMV